MACKRISSSLLAATTLLAVPLISCVSESPGKDSDAGGESTRVTAANIEVSAAMLPPEIRHTFGLPHEYGRFDRDERGTLHGVTARYHKTGQLSRVLHFTKGLPSCQWLAFDAKGKLEWSHYYFPCNDKQTTNTKAAERKAPLRLKYSYLCRYSGNRQFRCKSTPEVVHDLGTFLPDTLQEALLEGLNNLVDESSQTNRLAALVGCTVPKQQQGVAVVDVAGAIEDATTDFLGASGMTLDQAKDFLQSALTGGSADRLGKVLQSACGDTASFVGRNDEGNHGQGPSDNDALETAVGGSIDTSATKNASAILRKGIQACEAREAQESLLPSPEQASMAWTLAKTFVQTHKKEIITAVGVLIADKTADQVIKAMDDGFKEGDDCSQQAGKTVCPHSSDPDRQKVTDKVTGEVQYLERLENGNTSTTTTTVEEFLASDVPANEATVADMYSVKKTTVATTERTPQGQEKETSELVTEEREYGDGTEITIYFLNVTTTNEDGTKTTKRYFSMTGKDGSWQLYETATSSPTGGGAGLPAEDHISVCTKMQTFLDTCTDLDWSSKRCQGFVRLANGCEDPSLINPGSEGNLVCTAPNAATGAGDSKTTHCSSLGGLIIVDPEGDYSCSPPKPDRERLVPDICNDPAAMCSPIDSTLRIPGS